MLDVLQRSYKFNTVIAYYEVLEKYFIFKTYWDKPILHLQVGIARKITISVSKLRSSSVSQVKPLNAKDKR